MPRPPRIDIEDRWHHVMNRGIDHARVFFADSDRIEFGQRLGDVFDRFGIRTHAYCLMDNHFHLLWHCPDGRLCTDHVFDGWKAQQIDRFIVQPLDSVAQSIECDIAALVEAIDLVLAQRGLSAERRLGAARV